MCSFHLHAEDWMSICQVAAVYWASLVVQLVKNPPAMQETWFHSWVRKIPWRLDRLPTPVLLGFPGGSHCKEAACNSGDLGLIPGLGRSPGEGHGNTLQCSGLENPHGRRAWRVIVHGITKSQDTTERLSTQQNIIFLVQISLNLSMIVHNLLLGLLVTVIKPIFSSTFSFSPILVFTLYCITLCSPNPSEAI